MNERRNDYQKDLKGRVRQFCEEYQCNESPELVGKLYQFVRAEALASFMNGKQKRKQPDPVRGSALENGKLLPVRH